MSVTTPLGPDVLLLETFEGTEALSRLFHFHLGLLAPEKTEVAFDKIMGQEVLVTMDVPSGGKRYFHGLVRSFSQSSAAAVGSTNVSGLIRYEAEVVPRFWLWKRQVRSRIFQERTVPEILKEVLSGLRVTFELRGTYPRRNYCVQYQESDYAFASRLMEEEGIFYLFQHTADGHQMIVTDTPSAPPQLPGSARIYAPQNTVQMEERVVSWRKTQQLRSGKCTLWDYCFQMPGKNLGASHTIQETVQAGLVVHQLKSSVNQALERFGYPGGFQHHCDGVDPTGCHQPTELQKLFEHNERVATIRMQQEAANALVVQGRGSYRQFSAGFRFTLQGHPNADGPYVLTQVKHFASLEGSYTASAGAVPAFTYRNRFTCVPLGLPFRPQQRTKRPRIAGPQTAVVIGPTGQDIFTDAYGRIRVQFFWDRQGASRLHNEAGQPVLATAYWPGGADPPSSSCWVRVAQPWAGANWGAMTIPRIGQEVVVAFEDGDPDRPLAVGSVYNAVQMPPFPLPQNATQSGIKSRSRGGAEDNFSGLGIEDAKGGEHVHLHSERFMTHSAEQNLYINAGQQHHVNVGQVSTRRVGGLPGLDHTFTKDPDEEDDNGSGGGEGPGNTNGPKRAPVGRVDGSGTVQGLTMSGPYGWNTSVPGGPAADLDLVLGWRRCNTAGLYNTSVIGSYLTTTINPGGLVANYNISNVSPLGQISDFSAAWAGFGATMGSGTTVYGANTSVTYGPIIGIHRGNELKATGTRDPIGATACKLAATLYAGVVVLDVLMPLLDFSDKSWGTWAQIAAGPGGLAAAEISFGLMVGLELANSYGQQLRDAKNLAETLVSWGMEDEAKAWNAERASAWVTNAADALAGGLFGGIEGPGGPEGLTMPFVHNCNDLYTVSAPGIALSCTADPESIDAPFITLQALGNVESGGAVWICGSSLVDVVAGSQAFVHLETVEDLTGAIVIDCGEVGAVTLQSGITQEPNCIVMGPEGIRIASLVMLTLQTAEYTILVDPEEGITLTVGETVATLTPEGIVLSCGGSSIEITPEGVVINGPTVTINGEGETTISTAALMITQ